MEKTIEIALEIAVEAVPATFVLGLLYATFYGEEFKKLITIISYWMFT